MFWHVYLLSHCCCNMYIFYTEINQSIRKTVCKSYPQTTHVGKELFCLSYLFIFLDVFSCLRLSACLSVFCLLSSLQTLPTIPFCLSDCLSSCMTVHFVSSFKPVSPACPNRIVLSFCRLICPFAFFLPACLLCMSPPHLFAYLPVCQTAYPPTCLLVCQFFVFPPACIPLPVPSPASQPTCLIICSACLCICLFYVFLPACLRCLSNSCLSVRLSVCLSV